METTRSLIDVLGSLADLYEEMLGIMQDERQCIITWDVDRTFELAKKKDTILYKERVLEEARKSIVERLRREYGVDELTLSGIIERTDDDAVRGSLTNAQERLMSLMERVHSENVSLKILYKSNMKMISEFFMRVGVSDTAHYDRGKRVAAGGGASINRMG